MRRKRLVVPAGLEHARQRFERWRGGGQGRRRIPDPLWATAVQAAQRFGVHRTCRALRLDYAILKRRVEVVAAGDPSRADPRPAFVELAPGRSLSPGECVMELDDPSGARMRIALKGVSGADLVALVGRLRDGRS